MQTVQANWKKLADRLSDEIARGYSLGRIATESGLTKIGGAGRDDSHSYAVERLRRWSQSAENLRSDSPYADKNCVATEIENKLSRWFEQLDCERTTGKNSTLSLVKTSVSEKVWSGFLDAREMCEVVEIDAPPGTGKTSAAELYRSQCRKLEGFTCPVWLITLSEFSVSLKTVLQMIAQEIDPHCPYANGSDNDLKNWIGQRTEGRGAC